MSSEARALGALAAALARAWPLLHRAVRRRMHALALARGVPTAQVAREVMLTAAYEVLTEDQGQIPPDASVDDTTDWFWHALLRRLGRRLSDEDEAPRDHVPLDTLERLVEDPAALAAVLDAEELDEAHYELRAVWDLLTPSEQQYVTLKRDHPDVTDAVLGTLMTPRRSAAAMWTLKSRLRQKLAGDPM